MSMLAEFGCFNNSHLLFQLGTLKRLAQEREARLQNLRSHIVTGVRVSLMLAGISRFNNSPFLYQVGASKRLV